jgi:hypothetical protein
MKTEYPQEFQRIEALHYKSACRGSIPDGVNVIFHWHNPSGRTGVDSACNGNEHQEYFVGVKAASA